MKKLYSFCLDYGRSGDLEGLFVAEESEISDIINKEVCFGEVLGKHSWVIAEMEESMFSVIDIPQEIINVLEEKIGKTISGYNPLEYCKRSKKEEDDENNDNEGEEQ